MSDAKFRGLLIAICVVALFAALAASDIARFGGCQ